MPESIGALIWIFGTAATGVASYLMVELYRDLKSEIKASKADIKALQTLVVTSSVRIDNHEMRLNHVETIINGKLDEILKKIH